MSILFGKREKKSKLGLTIILFVVFRVNYRMRLFRINLAEMKVVSWSIGLGT